MSFPRYPQYKASGVEWLGDVPEHWHIDRIKRSTASCQNGIWGDEAQQDENDIPCVRVADFDRQRLCVELNEPTIRNVSERERWRILNQGDLLLEKSGGGENQPVGCVVLYDDPHPAVCSNFVARVKLATDMNPSFWRYLHAAAYAVRLNTKSIKQNTGIQNLDASQYFDEQAAFPPFSEQTQIATFLDRETAKIDGLVVEQRRLMELLKEKRTAVISHAVTKGLNPDAPMKPSGIEWLGDVPEHWIVKKLGRVVFMQEGPGLRTWQFTDEGTRVICVTNITEAGIDFSCLEKFISTDEYNSAYRHFTVRSGDVLLSSSGSSWGKVAIYEGEEEVILNTSTIRLNECEGMPLKRDYIAMLLRSITVREQLGLAMTGSCQPNFGPTHLNCVMVAVPPRDEQATIVEYLDTETAKLDTLAAEAQRAIDLLQERRTAIISAATTGQIDVRDFAKWESEECPTI